MYCVDRDRFRPGCPPQRGQTPSRTDEHRWVSSVRPRSGTHPDRTLRCQPFLHGRSDLARELRQWGPLLLRRRAGGSGARDRAHDGHTWPFCANLTGLATGAAGMRTGGVQGCVTDRHGQGGEAPLGRRRAKGPRRPGVRAPVRLSRRAVLCQFTGPRMPRVRCTATLFGSHQHFYFCSSLHSTPVGGGLGTKLTARSQVRPLVTCCLTS